VCFAVKKRASVSTRLFTVTKQGPKIDPEKRMQHPEGSFKRYDMKTKSKSLQITTPPARATSATMAWSFSPVARKTQVAGNIDVTDGIWIVAISLK
jgi:hypothetical protein